VTALRLDRRAPVVAALAAAGGATVALAIAAGCSGRAPVTSGDEPVAARLSVAAALQAPETRGFARALAPRPFAFPADHGPHPDFRTEWWYYTGNLAARDGRRFGFQLTFFRTALSPPAPPAAPDDGAGALQASPAARTSAWATRQVYFAHFAVTDVATRRFRAYERWERQALGLAGAEASPFRVWVGDWSAAAAGPAVAGTPPMRLRATAGGAAEGSPATDATAAGPGASGEMAIDVILTSTLPPVAQGDRGLSAKSAAPGNASYYYSLPRLAAAGRLRTGGGETLAVTGLAWMDREWSTSSLAAGEVGWDWFALQLDDGWELMLYRLRRGSGAADPASRATLIAPDGSTTVFPLDALRLSETAHWTSPASRVRYPAGWHLTMPAGAANAAAGHPGGLDLTVSPLLPDQELPLSLRYWEGAVAAHGTHDGRPVTARGYVELTGYEPRPRSR
jgi:predicted secreted hydrolase